jgi:hypothetical protein
MTDCPHHDGTAREEPACELQRLADHTITVTEARAPWAGCVMIVIERDDYSHTALGASVSPVHALTVLEHHAARLRALMGL